MLVCVDFISIYVCMSPKQMCTLYQILINTPRARRNGYNIHTSVYLHTYKLVRSATLHTCVHSATLTNAPRACRYGYHPFKMA